MVPLKGFRVVSLHLIPPFPSLLGAMGATEVVERIEASKLVACQTLLLVGGHICVETQSVLRTLINDGGGVSSVSAVF